MLNDFIYEIDIQWMIFGFVSSNEIDGWDDSVGRVEIQLGIHILTIVWIISKSEMLPIIELSGLRMAYGEIWVEGKIVKT